MANIQSLVLPIPHNFALALKRMGSLVLVFGWISCSQNDKQDLSHQVFRYNEYGNITSLDPAFSRNLPNIWATTQLFNGLVQLDNNLNVIPDIAKDWKISEDGLNYRFILRDDVFFHEDDAFGPDKTRSVTAQDFVYSFQRLIDPQLASPGSWVMQNVIGVRAISEKVLSIDLRKPFPAFLGLLSMRYCSVVPREVITKRGEQFRKHPIGTGPFAFKIWEEEVKLVFRKNPYYFERDSLNQPLPYLEAIAITFVPDKQSEFMLFLQGKLDLLNSLDNSYKDELLTLQGTLNPEYQQSINLQKGPYLNTEYLGFYLDHPSSVIRSPLIREAINIGFDRKKMMTYLRNNIGFIGNKGFVPRGLGGHGEQEMFAYQPEKAKALVNTFKQESGQEAIIHLATDANYVDLCEYLQRELEKIGISLQVEVMPPPTLKQARSSGQLQMFRANWIADYPDAENYLSLFYSKNFSPQGPNYTHHKNSDFDELYEQAFTINDPNLREKSYQKMDSLAMSHFPLVPLYYDQITRFVQKQVIGLTLNPLNVLKLKSVKKNK